MRLQTVLCAALTVCLSVIDDTRLRLYVYANHSCTFGVLVGSCCFVRFSCLCVQVGSCCFVRCVCEVWVCGMCCVHVLECVYILLTVHDATTKHKLHESSWMIRGVVVASAADEHTLRANAQVTFNSLINACAQAGQVDKAFEVYESLQAAGLAADQVIMYGSMCVCRLCFVLLLQSA